MNRPIETQPDRLVPLPEARRERLGSISNGKLYDLVSKGEIQLTKVGRRSFLKESEIARFLSEITSDRGAR